MEPEKLSMELEKMSAKSSRKCVVAIDGPAGVGKSTVARRLAQHLGYCYVDSGAMYRAGGWLVQAQALAFDDVPAITTLLVHMPPQLRWRHDQLTVWIADREVTGQVAGEEVGKAASAVARIPAVRELITAQLRQVRCQADVVMEGRDIGTVVFPDATVKFFLEASPTQRSQRRWDEMQQAGHTVTLEQVRQAVATRDAQDRNREVAPLTPADDARMIDTTDLTVDDVVRIMVSEVQFKNLQDGG